MSPRTLPTLMLLALSGIVPAALAAQPGLDDHPATARLTAEHRALVPGTTAMLGVTWDIDPGWHMYWKGVNDSGFAPEVELSLPDGYRAGEILWPAPRRKVFELWEGPDGLVLDHAYEDRVLLMIPVEVPADARPGSTVTFAADLDWLICEEVCIPGSASVMLSLPVDIGGASPGRDAALFEATRKRLPQALPEEEPPVTIQREDGSFVLKATTQREDVRKIAFYPTLESADLKNLIEDGEASKPKLTLRLADSEQADAHLVGVVEIWTAPATSSIWWIDTRPEPTDERPEQTMVPAATD